MASRGWIVSVGQGGCGNHAWRRRYWRGAGSGVLQVSLPDAYWNRLGLLPLTQTWQRLNPTAWRTAGCGPACPVVW